MSQTESAKTGRGPGRVKTLVLGGILILFGLPTLLIMGAMFYANNLELPESVIEPPRELREGLVAAQNRNRGSQTQQDGLQGLGQNVFEALGREEFAGLIKDFGGNQDWNSFVSGHRQVLERAYDYFESSETTGTLEASYLLEETMLADLRGTFGWEHYPITISDQVGRSSLIKACRILEGAISVLLLNPKQYRIGTPVENFPWNQAAIIIEAALEKNAVTDEYRERVRRKMDRLAETFAFPTSIEDMMWSKYATQRDNLMAMARGPVTTEFFGWDTQYRWWMSIVGLEVPNPVRYARGYFDALRTKKDIGWLIGNYDAQCLEIIRAAGLSYRERKNRGYFSPPVMSSSSSLPDALHLMDARLETLAYFNLIRLALDRDLNLQSRPAEGTVDFAAQSWHPWRDPFTDQPMVMREIGGRWHVYSIGPDLVDQLGEEQDGSYGGEGWVMARKGDIGIKLPKQVTK